MPMSSASTTRRKVSKAGRTALVLTPATEGCRQPGKRHYSTQEHAQAAADWVNRENPGHRRPAEPYRCPCGWWHVGRPHVVKTTCGWCGVEFTYLQNAGTSLTPPRWCKPTHATKGKKHKRGKIPDDPTRGQRVD